MGEFCRAAEFAHASRLSPVQLPTPRRQEPQDGPASRCHAEEHVTRGVGATPHRQYSGSTKKLVSCSWRQFPQNKPVVRESSNGS